MKKLFLAIATYEGLEQAATQIVKKLKINADQKQIEVRWVPPSNYHVTLVFLGNMSEEKTELVKQISTDVAQRFAPFSLKISDIGAFPDEFSSRVLWFGVQNSKALRSLQETLTLELKTLSYARQEEDSYSPHLTIGRLRNPHSTKDMASPFRRKKIAKIQITEFVLYESVGSVPFPVYKPLARFQLTGTPSEEVSSDSSSSEAD